MEVGSTTLKEHHLDPWSVCPLTFMSKANCWSLSDSALSPCLGRWWGKHWLLTLGHLWPCKDLCSGSPSGKSGFLCARLCTPLCPRELISPPSCPPRSPCLSPWRLLLGDRGSRIADGLGSCGQQAPGLRLPALCLLVARGCIAALVLCAPEVSSALPPWSRGCPGATGTFGPPEHSGGGVGGLGDQWGL